MEQSKRALDVYQTRSSKMPPHTIMTGVYAINRTELMGVKEIFEDLSDKVLSPKHRQARDICLTQLKVLENLVLSDKDDINDPSFAYFVQSFVDWITAMHNVMLDQSSWGRRKRNYNLFIEKYIDYAPDYLQKKVEKEITE